MSDIKFAISNFDIILVVDGRASTVGLSHPNYLEICRALQSGDFERGLALLDVKATIEKVYAGKGLGATITENKHGDVEFTIAGHTLTGEIANLMLGFKNAKLPMTAIVKFWTKFMSNALLGGEADYVRRQDLLRFLIANKLVLTPEGNFIAFKGVRRNMSEDGPRVYRSWHDSRFCYEIDQVATEPAARKISDIHVACGVGLHAGAIGFAKSYGDLRLAVEIDPSDVVTVPSDNDSHLRCWKLIPRAINPNDEVPVASFWRLGTPAIIHRTGESETAVSPATAVVAPMGPMVSKESVKIRVESHGGNKIQVIRVFSEHMGLSLQDAVLWVDALPQTLVVQGADTAQRVLAYVRGLPGVVATEDVPVPAKKKRSGGRTPKAMWYKVVAGKLIRQRKVTCPGTGWASDIPKTTTAKGAQTNVKAAVPKGVGMQRTYYKVAADGKQVRTVRATTRPAGYTGTRPSWFTKKS